MSKVIDINSFMKLIKKNSFLILIIVVSFFLMFSNLGDRTLGFDELDTKTWAKNIKTCGFPNYVACDKDTKINLEYFSTQYPETYLIKYIEYFSTSVLGQSEFASRLPFALAGFISIILFYYFARDITNVRVAMVSTFLYGLSPIIYIHARSSRYYSFIFLFGILCTWSLWKMINERGGYLIFIVSSILLFFIHLQIFGYLFFSYIVASLVFYFKKGLDKKVFLSFFCVVVFIAPLLFIWIFKLKGLSKGHVYFNLLLISFNLALSFFYYFLVLFPFIFIFFLPNLIKSRKGINSNYLYLIIILVSATLFISFFNHNGLPELRKLVSMSFPIFCIINGAIIERISKRKKMIAGILIVLLVSSNLLNLFPIYVVKFVKFGVPLVSSSQSESFIEKSLQPRIYLLDYFYEITHHYASPLEEILPVLNNKTHNKRIFSNVERLGLYDYLGVEVCTDEEYLKNTTFDWIITDKDLNVSLDDYDVIVINNKWEIWADSPDIMHHHFRTDRNGIIYVYHIKQASEI